MTFFEILVLLFLVVDPFGNIPLVILLLQNLDDRTFQRVLVRETLIALGIALFFFFAGGVLLSYLNITQEALSVAGGVILFLISVKMIFRSSSEIFMHEPEDGGPLVVPIAVPSISGPATLTTLMILRTHHGAGMLPTLSALVLVVLLQLILFLSGRRLIRLLGPHGLKALEKLTGLLLNLLAVNMILRGLAEAL
ncbi:MAG TPA: MarC family protein [Fibrobacteraceae bacterium]|nr:MarC family protein [Fibrobacteraceae bacterium]